MIEYPRWPNFDEWFNVKKGSLVREGQRFAKADSTGTIRISVADEDWIVEHPSNIRTEEPTYQPLPTEGGTLTGPPEGRVSGDDKTPATPAESPRVEYGRAFWTASGLFVDDEVYRSFEEAAEFTSLRWSGHVYDIVVTRVVSDWVPANE